MKHATRIALALTLLLAGRPVWAQGTLMPTPYQTVLDDTGAIVPLAKVCTYLAGTTTPVFTFTDQTLTSQNTNPIVASAAGRFTAWLNPALTYKAVYYNTDGTVNTCDGTVIKTVDGIGGVPLGASNTEDTGVSGEALALGKVVYLSDGQGAKVAGRWYLASNGVSYSAYNVQIGIVSSAAAGAALPVTVRLAGLASNVSGLTAGTVYYIDTAGNLATLAGTNGVIRRVVGTAQSATTILLGSAGEKVPGVQVLNQSAGSVSVVNTTTPTVVYNYTVPANTLGTYRTLRLTLTGLYTNGTGGPSNLTVTTTYGASPIEGPSTLTQYLAGEGGAWEYVIYLHANGATNLQTGTAFHTIAKTIGARAVGGSIVDYNTVVGIDSTLSQALAIVVTHSVASATINWTMFATTLELIGQ